MARLKAEDEAPRGNPFPMDELPEELTDDILGDAEKIMLYGAPGTGKTELAATAPGPQYWLIVGPRNELKTLRSPGFKKRHGATQIRYDFVQEEDRTKRGAILKPRAYDHACYALDRAWAQHESGQFPFETIVIENASTLMNVEMNKAIALGSLGSIDKGNKAFERWKEDNIVQPADSDWGGAQSLMRQFINWVYDLPVHVIVIAHERVESKKDRKTREDLLLNIGPSFVGQQRIEMPGLFDNVWRTQLAEGTRGVNAIYEVNTVGDDVIYGKTRVGGVLKPVETFLRIDEAIRWFRDGSTVETRRHARRAAREG